MLHYENIWDLFIFLLRQTSLDFENFIWNC